MSNSLQFLVTHVRFCFYFNLPHSSPLYSSSTKILLSIATSQRFITHQYLTRLSVVYDRFQAYAQAAFDVGRDQEKLFVLWAKKFPGEPLPPIPSDEWPKLGFQVREKSIKLRYLNSGILGIRSRNGFPWSWDLWDGLPRSSC